MLLDTSGLLCLIHRREAQHERAISLYDAATPESANPQFVTSHLLGSNTFTAETQRTQRWRREIQTEARPRAMIARRMT